VEIVSKLENNIFKSVVKPWVKIP